MALITCGGADVERGRIHFPRRGAWYARLKLDTATLPSGRVTIAAAGGLAIAGTIVQPSGVFLDSAHVSIVGGAGGLSAIIAPASYENALIRDPLAAIVQASGETISTTISATITTVLLPAWTHVAERATEALDHLTYSAGQALGKPLVWRVLGDGTIWLGEETWPAAALPAGADIVDQEPGDGRCELGVQTPALLPGVDLAGVGKVAAVDHWIEPHEVRTWAWAV